MSIDLIVSALDTTRFYTVCGGKDEELLQRVLKAKGVEIASHDEYFRDWVGPDKYQSLRVAIRQIISGTIDGGLEPLFQFEHAAAMIADVVGMPLESEILMDAKEAFWMEVNQTIDEYRDALGKVTEWLTLEEVLTRGPLLDIPLSPIRLGTGFLTPDEVSAHDAALPPQLEIPVGCADQLTWPDEVLEALQAYREWIGTAAEHRLGLFFHH
jgi:hypothetical protein